MEYETSGPSSDSFRSKAVSGLTAVGAAQAIKLGTGFLSTVVLARLLTPEDFGTFAMVAPVVGFVTMVQDFGFAQAIVAARTLDHAALHGMYRFNLVLSVALALMMLVAAPMIAAFYSRSAVLPVTCGLAGAVILSGASAVHMALLTRGLRFGTLAMIDTARVVGAFAIASCVAWLHPGPFALVAQSLASGLIGLVLVLMVAPLPAASHAAGVASLRPMLRLGAAMSTFNLANFVSRNADNVLIGWGRGAVELGWYDRAYRLLLFPLAQVNQPATGIMIPIMSRLTCPRQYRSIYLRSVGVVMAVTIPSILSMLLTAPTLIPMLMGEGWRQAAVMFQWLALAGLAQTLANTFGWLFVSQLRVGEYARFGLVNVVISLLAFAGGLPWGAWGVAVGYGLSSLTVRLPLGWWQAGRRGPVSRRDILSQAAPFYLSGLVAVAGWWVVASPTAGSAPVASSAIQIGCVLACFWATLLLLPVGRKTFSDIYGLLPQRIRRAVRAVGAASAR